MATTPVGSSPSSSASPIFPARAFLQGFNGSPTPTGAMVAAELRRRGVKDSDVVVKSTEDMHAHPLPLDTHSLVMGDFHWTRSALAQLGIPMPQPPDYPECLRHLLHREIWLSTLGDVQRKLQADAASSSHQDHHHHHSAKQYFIKPASDVKAFSAIIEPRDQMLDALLSGIPGCLDPLPASLPVLCAEVVEMLSEYRVYVVRGEIRAVCCYKESASEQMVGAAAAEGADGKAGTGASTLPAHPQLDMDVVRAAVRTFCASPEGKEVGQGCSLDFAIMRKRVEGLCRVEGLETVTSVGTTTAAQGGRETACTTVTCLVEVNDGFSLGCYEGISASDYTDLLCARWESLMKSARV